MRTDVSILAATLVFSMFALAPVPARADHHSAHPASHQGTPPGLAKKGGMPPGLAKKFGPNVPEKAYVAIDPRYDDRAWFLIDGRWVLRDGFDDSLRVEVRSLMNLTPPPQPPPVPLPSGRIDFHLVLFD